MAHFYLNELIDAASPGSTVGIAGGEVRHAVTVSRVAVGDPLTIGNGRGLVIHGTVTTAEHTELSMVAESITVVERTEPAIILVQALAKGDRDEMAVQASTELGVDVVVPWSASRSISRWEGAKVAKGMARWNAIVREASKQSVRAGCSCSNQPPSRRSALSSCQRTTPRTSPLSSGPRVELRLTSSTLLSRPVQLSFGWVIRCFEPRRQGQRLSLCCRRNWVAGSSHALRWRHVTVSVNFLAHHRQGDSCRHRF
jgi:hypothetical protein